MKHTKPSEREPVRVYPRGDGFAVTAGHDTTRLCWCQPVLVHTTESGREVWVHRKSVGWKGGSEQFRMPPKQVIRRAIKEAEDQPK